MLISDSTVSQLRAPGGLREIDLLRVRGKSRPIAVFEPLACHPAEQREKRLAALPAFDEGRHLYRSRRWRDAGRRFGAALERCPDDIVARLFVDRCAYFEENDPGPDWDGVWSLTQK